MTKGHAVLARRYRIPLRTVLFAALGTGAGAAAVFGGVVTLLAGHSVPPRAGNCGLIACSASLPVTPSPSPSPTPKVTHHHRAVRHKPHVPPPTPLASSPSPTPSVSPSPTPSPARTHVRPTPSPKPSLPAVTVSYSLGQQWDGGFQGRFTIVNHGSTPLTGWTLAATFPGDQIDSVWNATYQTHGDTLILTPAPYLPSVPPGGSLSAFFTANGARQSPASCTFNGTACGG